MCDERSFLCAKSRLFVLRKNLRLSSHQPGGIRRTLDKPPPRQLSFFPVQSLVQALLYDRFRLSSFHVRCQTTIVYNNKEATVNVYRLPLYKQNMHKWNKPFHLCILSTETIIVRQNAHE